METAIATENIGMGTQVSITRDSIMEFEKRLAILPNVLRGNNAKNPLKHSFCDGLYMREIFNPAGMCLTGKIHKKDHIAFLVKGEMTVASEEGGVKHLKAPMVFPSTAGF
jgi:hypothetical protein